MIRYSYPSAYWGMNGLLTCGLSWTPSWSPLIGISVTRQIWQLRRFTEQGTWKCCWKVSPPPPPIVLFCYAFSCKSINQLNLGSIDLHANTSCSTLVGGYLDNNNNVVAINLINLVCQINKDGTALRAILGKEASKLIVIKAIPSLYNSRLLSLAAASMKGTRTCCTRMKLTQQRLLLMV